MSSNSRDFIDYVTSIISLDALEKMTNEMDEEIKESQKLMDQIKNMFDSIPNVNSSSTSSGSRREDLASKILEADTPNLLLPDMVPENFDGDLNDIIACMKQCVEDLRSGYQEPGPKMEVPTKELPDLELDQYAVSLDQLGKRLANIKLSNKVVANKRNPELEKKLAQLCDNVNNFTQLVQTKTRLSEANQSFSEPQQEKKGLQYNDCIKNLLSLISEVDYFLQNKN